MRAEVTIHEAKTHLSRLLARAHAGEEIIIRRGRVPMARLVPLPDEGQPRRSGRLRGLIDVPEDFDTRDTEWLAEMFGT